MANLFFAEKLTYEQRWEIADSVAGSCQAPFEGAFEYFRKKFDLNDEVIEELGLNFAELAAEFELFKCEDCGWWGDMGEVGECDDCGGELI